MPPKTAAKTIPAEVPSEGLFYITAQAASRPPRVLKYGDSFVVLDGRGDIAAASGRSAGLFHQDTRYLSRLELLVNGIQPLLLGSNLRDDNSAFFVDLTNPDFLADQHLILEKDTVHILRAIFLWRDTAYQRFGVRNYGDRPVDLQLSILFENDFADLFEVRGSRRERRGTATAKVRSDDQVLLIYHGLDNKVRHTTVNFDPPPNRLATNAATYDLRLAPKETRPLFLSVSCDRTDSRPPPFLRGRLAARRELRAATRNQTSVETSNDRFNEVLCRSAADLAMLMTDTPQGRYPYAGIPWFSTTFGRDGLITALQMLWWSPDVARGVLRRLAAHQAKTTDPFADAQPGKILHEMRGGEMAALREVPFGLYYGSVDSTPLFVLLAGLYCEAHRRYRIPSPNCGRRSRQRLAGSTALATRTATASSNTYVRPTRVSPTKAGRIRMTPFSMPTADWRKARSRSPRSKVTCTPPSAWRPYWRGGSGATAMLRGLMPKQTACATASRAAFWCPEIETYALALDGEKKPCRVRTSNAGQVLFTGIASPARGASRRQGAVAAVLLLRLGHPHRGDG